MRPEKNVPNETSCAADDDGRTCPRMVVMTRPVALCGPHKAEVALAIVPDLLRDQLATAHRDAAGGVAGVRDDLVTRACSVAHLPFLDGGLHQTVVYFIANGGRVKIGYTTNLKSRLSSLALRADSVLLTLDGGPDLERALHAHFQAHRDGNTEWFELAPTIFRYITARQGAGAVSLASESSASAPPRPRLAKVRPGRAKTTRDEAKAAIRALYGQLGRRPIEPEMIAELKQMRYGCTSRAHAGLLRREIERDSPELTGTGN